MSASSNTADAASRPTASQKGTEQFSTFVAANRLRIEAALEDTLPLSTAAGTERFNEALRTAVFPGGKRLRPHLTLIGAGLGGATDAQALGLACAVEFLHTSSLILDDLPCMDDAALRRNSPALHIAFGEGVAILVAVSLLNQAYALLGGAARDSAQAERLPRLIGEAARCIGSSGMIAGQAAELALSGSSVTAESALASRDLKTTALMRLMMVAGGILTGAPEREVTALATFGECLGRAYQIYDDLADALGDLKSTGKSVGQDERHLRPTAVNGLSPDEARKLAADVLESGKSALDQFEGRPGARLLHSAADHIFARLYQAHASPR